MRNRLDLPEPFKPKTPILAPGKNDNEMFFKMVRLGGTTLLTRFMENINLSGSAIGSPKVV